MVIQVFREKGVEKVAQESIPNYRKIKNEITRDDYNRTTIPKDKTKRKRVRR